MAMEQKEMTSMGTTNVAMPDDIVENILTRLPVKSLVRFRCASKAWYKLQKNANFIKLHLIRSKEDRSNVAFVMGYWGPYSGYYMVLGLPYDWSYHLDEQLGIGNYNEYWERKLSSFSSDFENFKFGWMVNSPLQILNCDAQILGSCNGIVCITPDSMTTIFLSNPSTRQVWEVPCISDGKLLDFSVKYIFAFGFGYDANSDDYKIVRTASFLKAHTEDDPSEVQVYSSRQSLWRRIEDTQYRILDVKPGELVSGALHWVGIHFPKQDNCVIAFDLEDEKFREVALPGHGSTTFNVATLDEKLSMVCHHDTYAEVWVMEECGAKEAWVKLFRIADPYNSRTSLLPLSSTKDGAVVLMNNYNAVIEYDQNSRCVKSLFSQCASLDFFAKTYVESLVSLDINNDSAGTSGTKQQGEKEAE